MKLSGTPEAIMEHLLLMHPEAEGAIERARSATIRGKQEIYAYQAAALYGLASGYNLDGATILEIGTYWGFSAAVMAQAAPKATVITLNPTPWEWEEASKNLRSFGNVRALCAASWDYLETFAGKADMIFVDGDHKQVRRDLPWWEKLHPDGLMVFHDYSPNGSARACPPVWRALHDFEQTLGRAPDVLVIDDQQVGMAGWYKRGE